MSVDTSFILSEEEQRFLLDTLRNVVFDLAEDDDLPRWGPLIEEINQIFDIFGEPPPEVA